MRSRFPFGGLALLCLLAALGYWRARLSQEAPRLGALTSKVDGLA